MDLSAMQAFNLVVPTVEFGNGAIAQLGERVRQLGATNVVVFTDEGLVQAGVSGQVVSLLEAAQVPCRVFDKVEKEPSLENVVEGYRFASEGAADLLIGLGGGSSMDVTKVVAILLRHGGSVRDFLGIDNVPGRGVPTVLVPTTAGTGSEVSKYAIFDDRQAKTKLGIVSLHLVADLSLIDPELTVSMPPAITAATGSDAFIHAVEGYLATKATPITDLLALEAVRVIYQNLPAAFADGGNLSARYGMSYGSFLAGIVLNHAGGSASHALGYPVASEYHVPHGVACMLTFLELMDFFAMANVPKFARMAQAMGVNTEHLSPRQAAEAAVVEMRNLVEYIEIPHTLDAVGMDRELVKPFAASVVANQQRLLTNAPRRLTARDVEVIYGRSFRS